MWPLPRRFSPLRRTGMPSAWATRLRAHTHFRRWPCEGRRVIVDASRSVPPLDPVPAVIQDRLIGGAPAATQPGVLTSIFGWEPVVWMIRVSLLVVCGVALYIFILNTLRFFRLSNAWAMITGPLPRLTQLGGKIAGVEATASLASSDTAMADQLRTVNTRIDDLEAHVDAVTALVNHLARGGIDDTA